MSENPTEQSVPESEEQVLTDIELELGDENADDEPLTVTVGGYPEKKLLPAYFFGSIVKLGLAPSLKPVGVTVESRDSAALTATLAGGHQDLQAIAEDLIPALYEVLPGELAAFKKEFKPKAEGKEGHKESWIARRDFCVEFARGFTAEFFQEADDSFARAYSAGVAACARTFAIEGDIDNSDELL